MRAFTVCRERLPSPKIVIHRVRYSGDAGCPPPSLINLEYPRESMERRSLVTVLGPQQMAILTVNFWLLLTAGITVTTGVIHWRAITVTGIACTLFLIAFTVGAVNGKRGHTPR